MTSDAVQRIKNRIWRRIVVKSAVFAFWIASLFAMGMGEGVELLNSVYLRPAIIVLAVWIASTMRDVRRLRNKDALERAAIEENDERNVLISYKATRMAVVIMVCLLPVAMLFLAFNEMHYAIDVLAIALCVFLLVYLVSWFCIAKRS